MKNITLPNTQTKPENINETLQKTVKELADYKYAFDESFITAITDQKGIITFVNDNFCKISQYSREELIGQDHRIINSGFHDKKFIRNLWVTIANGKIWRGEFKNKAKDGTYYWVDNTVIPFLNERGKPCKYLAIRVDITDKKEAEEKLYKVNRRYAFISEINKCIVHAQDDNDLFRNVCSLAIEFGKFRMAWIGLFNSKNEKITIVAQKGIPSRSIKLFKNKLLEAGSPPLNVLETGTYYFCNDTSGDHKFANREQFAPEHGIYSCILLPIRRSGNIIGIFNLYSTQSNFFDTDEIELLLEVTGGISFALDDFEKAKKQKAAEDITAQNEKLFQALIEKSSDMKVLTTVSGKIFYASPSVAMVMGYSIEEIRKKKAFDFFHPGDLPDFLEKRNAVLQVPGGSFYFQLRLRHKYGHYIWGEGTFTNMLHAPAIHAIIINFRDITDRVLAAEKLSKSESRLKEAQAIAHVGNWEVDLINNTTVWSDELYNLLGVAKYAVEPSFEFSLSFVHPDDLNFVKKSLGESFKKRQGTEIEFRFIDTGGRIRYAHGESRLKLDGAGNRVMHFGIIQDITERKLLELERTSVLNDLIKRNSELEQFAYIISHNLRSPVANIIGASNALNDTELTAEDKEILYKGVNISAMRLDEVVKDLNHILDVNSNISEIKEIVDFAALVEDIKVGILNLIDKHYIEIRCDFSAISELFTLRSYFYSIFYNLISNSIKYRSRHVNTLIEIKSCLVKDKLELIFTDNGIGIDLNKTGIDIFGLYKRFHPNIAGKGIGLFMVKTQVEALGGNISVQSKENEGTEFKIEFKL